MSRSNPTISQKTVFQDLFLKTGANLAPEQTVKGGTEKLKVEAPHCSTRMAGTFVETTILSFLSFLALFCPDFKINFVE